MDQVFYRGVMTVIGVIFTFGSLDASGVISQLVELKDISLFKTDTTLVQSDNSVFLSSISSEPGLLGVFMLGVVLMIGFKWIRRKQEVPE